MKTITLKGITYKVLSEHIIPYKNLGRISMTLQKLNGKVWYHVVKYENDTYSSVTSMGFLDRMKGSK